MIKKVIILLIIATSILISGCINVDVPIIKVNITFVEREGIVEADHYTLTPENISYIARPKKNYAESFPAIAGRTTMFHGKDTVIGPWETLPYKGSGVYTFNLGFDERGYPKANDMVHVTIMVVDKNGDRIGYVIENIKWK